MQSSVFFKCFIDLSDEITPDSSWSVQFPHFYFPQAEGSVLREPEQVLLYLQEPVHKQTG
jgi:hypothetical protein